MKNESLIELARETALKRTHTRSFLVGAAAIRSDGAVVHARNEAARLPTPKGHAEARLLKKLGRDGKVLVVVRVSRETGELTMARPCAACAALIKAYRVEKVFYSTGRGIELFVPVSV